MPAASAASTVSSRADASNDAGTVRTTSCFASARVAAAEARVPRLGEVLEVAPRRLDGRDLLDVLRRAERQDAARAGRPSDARASSWRSRSTRAGASTPRARAYSPTAKRALRVPREGLRRLRSRARSRGTTAGAAARRLPLRDELRDRRGPAGAASSPSSGANASAEWVVPRSMPTAKRVMTARPRRARGRARRGSPTISGSSRRVARQPRCRRTPVYGGCPPTCPSASPRRAAKPAASDDARPLALRRARARWSRGRGAPCGSRRGRRARRRRRRRRGTRRCPARGSRRGALRAGRARGAGAPGRCVGGLGAGGAALRRRGAEGRPGRRRGRELRGLAGRPDARRERPSKRTRKKQSHANQRRVASGRVSSATGASLPDGAPRAPHLWYGVHQPCPFHRRPARHRRGTHRVPPGLFHRSPRARRAHARLAGRRGHVVVRDRHPARRHPRGRRPLPRAPRPTGSRGLFQRDAASLAAGGRARSSPSLPAAVVGLLFRKAIKEHLFKPLPIAAALIVGGIVMIVVERIRAQRGATGRRRARARHADARARHRPRPVRLALAGLVAVDVHHRRRAALGPLDGHGRGVLVPPRAAHARRGDRLRGVQGA